MAELAKRRVITEEDFKRLYQCEWPPATMTSEQYEANRGCPHRTHDCACSGDCPWRMERERRLERIVRRKRRDVSI